MDERTTRVAANEALYYMNEKLEGLNEAFALATDTAEIVGEYGDIAWAEQIELSR
jgi:hypothetical protein